MKWSLKRKWFDLLSNSLNFPFKEIYRDQVGELVCGFWGETKILSLISRLIFVISTLNFACKSLLPSSLNWEKMTAIGYSHFSLQEYFKGFFYWYKMESVWGARPFFNITSQISCCFESILLLKKKKTGCLCNSTKDLTLCINPLLCHWKAKVKLNYYLSAGPFISLKIISVIVFTWKNDTAWHGYIRLFVNCIKKINQRRGFCQIFKCWIIKS